MWWGMLGGIGQFGGSVPQIQRWLYGLCEVKALGFAIKCFGAFGLHTLQESGTLAEFCEMPGWGGTEPLRYL